MHGDTLLVGIIEETATSPLTAMQLELTLRHRSCTEVAYMIVDLRQLAIDHGIKVNISKHFNATIYSSTDQHIDVKGGSLLEILVGLLHELGHMIVERHPPAGTYNEEFLAEGIAYRTARLLGFDSWSICGAYFAECLPENSDQEAHLALIRTYSDELLRSVGQQRQIHRSKAMVSRLQLGELEPSTKQLLRTDLSMPNTGDIINVEPARSQPV